MKLKQLSSYAEAVVPRSPAHASVCIAIACGSVLVAACRQPVAQSDRTIDRDAEAYVRVVLALAERDPDSLDSYFGPPAWLAEARAQHLSLAEVKETALTLLQRIATLKGSRYIGSRNADIEGLRYEFVTRQLR